MTSTFLRLMLLSLPVILSPAASNHEQLVIPSGSVLRCRFEDTVTMKSGALVSTVLTDPLYLGEILVFPEGTVVKGYITSVNALPFHNRARRLLGGDLTPPKTASVTFDQLILADGTILPISTGPAIGVEGVRKAIYGPSKPRPGLRQNLADSIRPLREPKKLQRLSRAAVQKLPYHPEFLERGAVFDTMLLAELKTSMPVQPTAAERGAEADLLHVRLLTPLSSSSDSNNTPVEAVVFRPYYSPDGTLRFPTGTMLDGAVSAASPSGRWQKHGTLRLEFHSATLPGSKAAPLKASVAGVEAVHTHSLSVDPEGKISAKNSRVAQVLAVTSLVGPSIATVGSNVNKTALARAGDGAGGFGLIGAGAAQSSSSAATGFAFFGAATKIYDAFLAHGAEIELPKNTPILLRIDQ